MSRRTIHPFPARMAPAIAIEALGGPATEQRLTVLDPMCGSGTVLRAAVASGHTAFGFDVDPLAVLMSRVAVSSYEEGDVLAAAHASVASARKQAPEGIPWHDSETSRFVDYWFGSEQAKDLGRLATVLQAVEDDSIRAALQIGLSRIIVTKSPQASLASDTSHSRPHRTAVDSTYDVFDGFLRSIGSLTRLLAKRDLRGVARVELGDARVLDAVPDHSVDLTITSPPYLNALDYLRGHKMSLIWLGYSIGELRAIRSASIGSERQLSHSAPPEVHTIVDSISSTVANPERLKLPLVTRFAFDMVQFADQMRRVIRPGGSLFVVVGNSTLRGNYIENDRITSTALQERGFCLIARTERALPRSSRYLPIAHGAGDAQLDKRMRSEIVLSMVAA